MVIELERLSLKNSKSTQLNPTQQTFSKSIAKILSKYSGRLVEQNPDHYLVSFLSASEAVTCALKIKKKYTEYFKGNFKGISKYLN